MRATTQPRFGGVESRLDGEHVSPAPYSGRPSLSVGPVERMARDGERPSEIADQPS